MRRIVHAGSIIPLYMHNPSRKYVLHMVDCFSAWGIPFLGLDHVLSKVKDAEVSGELGGVWLSYDDGWLSSMDSMVYLASEKIPFTLFMCTGEWEGLKIFAVGHEKYSKYESECSDMSMTLNKGQLKELYRSGYASIGVHTHSHLKANETDSVTYLADLDRSIREIKTVIGKRSQVFSYPHGITKPEIKEGLAIRGLSAAFTTKGGRITGGEDRYELPRIGIDQESWPLTLWHILRAR